MVFADDDLNVDAKIILVADNLNYPSARILRSRWPVRDLDIHNYVFQIAPVAARGGFFSQNPMFG